MQRDPRKHSEQPDAREQIRPRCVATSSLPQLVRPRSPTASRIFPGVPVGGRCSWGWQRLPHFFAHSPHEFRTIKLGFRSIGSRACDKPFPHPLRSSPDSNPHVCIAQGPASLGDKAGLCLKEFPPERPRALNLLLAWFVS